MTTDTDYYARSLPTDTNIVKVGQVWRSNDPRRKKEFEVIKIHRNYWMKRGGWGDYAETKTSRGNHLNTIWIRLDRLTTPGGNDGYTLVKDVDE